MAQIITIGYNPKNPNDPEQTTKIINVTASVGANGVNRKDDVIVVQALLKYALERRPAFRDAEFPVPCGANIEATIRLIKKYQRFNNRNDFYKVSVDGRIDPVNGGVFAHGTRKQMTLYSLHVDAEEAAIFNGQKSSTEAICQRWSFIRGILNNSGVGSLGLSLEPSNQGVGSLGLSLE